MWKRMTSDAPLSRVRATVRAGRDAMRVTFSTGCRTTCEAPGF